MTANKIPELCLLGVKSQLKGTHRPLPLFSDDEVGLDHDLVCIPGVTVGPPVAMKEKNHVGILL